MAKLSFTLRKYEYAMNQLYDEVHYNFHMLDDILSLFPPRKVVHKGSTRQVSSPKLLDKTFRPYKSNFCIDPNMFLQTDINKFTDLLFNLITSLQNQQRIHTFEIIFDTSDTIGNTIDGNDRNFWDVYIEMLEKLDYRFQGYKLYVNPDTAKKITEILPAEEQIQKAKDVVKAKREEYLAKKRTRRLY